MRLVRFFTAFGLALVMCLSFAQEGFSNQMAESTFSDAQKQEIEQLVRTLLTEKDPGIVIEAARRIHQQDEEKARVKAETTLKKNLDKIINTPFSPIGGNPKGDVTVMEFFDYNCPYCHKAQANLQALLQSDKNIRVVYKEFPIFGDSSLTISKIALAAHKQGKYEAFHQALMTASGGPLTEATVYRIAKATGLDVEKLKKDKDDPKIMEALQQNVSLARELGASGTPAFIIGTQFFSGLVPVEVMKDAIAKERAQTQKSR
ncbi:MAG: DsbA family protein [Alphaproteobacteria bacterium]|nr:DsbA family protein [Alphaproteobacteria bacterium]